MYTFQCMRDQGETLNLNFPGLEKILRDFLAGAGQSLPADFSEQVYRKLDGLTGLAEEILKAQGGSDPAQQERVNDLVERLRKTREGVQSTVDEATKQGE